MKLPTNNRKDIPKSGFRIQDQRYLNRYDNPTASPKIQVWTDDDLDEDEKQQVRYCPNCINTLMEYLEKADTWLCYSCGQRVNAAIDIPLKNPGQDDIYIPSAQQPRPPQYDPNDVTVHFFAAINLNEEEPENKGYEITHQSPDGRIQTRKMTDMSRLSEAIKF